MESHIQKHIEEKTAQMFRHLSAHSAWRYALKGDKGDESSLSSLFDIDSTSLYKIFAVCGIYFPLSDTGNGKIFKHHGFDS